MKHTTLVNFTCLLMIILILFGCIRKNEPEPDPPGQTTSLDGYWNRGDIVVYINGTVGTFYKVNSGDWLKALNQGFITIGSMKFKNLTRLKDDTFYSGQELWFYSNNQVITEVAWTITGEFNLRNNGNTLYVNTKDPWSDYWGSFEYTRTNP